MSGRPELPFLAAGGVAVVGSTIRTGQLPDLTRVAVGTIGLVILASATSDSAAAPLVRAVGLLVLLVACMSAVNAVIKSKSKFPASSSKGK